MNGQQGDEERFGQRAQALLRASVEGLDGRTRSKLTQARHVALAARPQPAWLAGHSRGWLAGAGASLAAVLVAVVVLNLRPGAQPAPTGINGAADDLALLADADALELTQEQDDYSFYEWAAGQASDDGTAVGT